MPPVSAPRRRRRSPGRRPTVADIRARHQDDPPHGCTRPPAAADARHKRSEGTHAHASSRRITRSALSPHAYPAWYPSFVDGPVLPAKRWTIEQPSCIRCPERPNRWRCGQGFEGGIIVRRVAVLAVLAASTVWATGNVSASPTVRRSLFAAHDPRWQMTDTGIGSPARSARRRRYALPSTRGRPSCRHVPRHGNDSCSWRSHSSSCAHGAVAVAMDYTGQRQTPSENYAGSLREGAAELHQGSAYFLKTYPIKKVFAFASAWAARLLVLPSRRMCRPSDGPPFSSSILLATPRRRDRRRLRREVLSTGVRASTSRVVEERRAVGAQGAWRPDGKTSSLAAHADAGTRTPS